MKDRHTSSGGEDGHGSHPVILDEYHALLLSSELYIISMGVECSSHYQSTVPRFMGSNITNENAMTESPALLVRLQHSNDRIGMWT